MKYNLRILKKQKSFQKTQICFPKCIEHQIFLGTQRYNYWGFLDITKLSNL